MALNKIWCDDVYLHAIIKKDHTTLPIHPYLGYVFNPIPSVEGVMIQEGSLCAMSYALGIPSWSIFGLVALTWEVLAPFSSAVPFFQFKWVADLDAFTNGHSQIKCSKAAAMVAMLLTLLSFLHFPGQAHYELLLHVLNPIGVVTLSTFFFISTILFQMPLPILWGS